MDAPPADAAATGSHDPHADLGPALAGALAAIAPLRARGGRLHLTVSLPVDHRRLQAHFSDAQGRSGWDRALFERLGGRDGAGYGDSRRLGAAIEPLFNDIADRQRGLFVQDFLIDTPSQPVPDDPDGENVFDEIELCIPAGLRWQTEGESFALELDAPVRLPARCRAFWVAHSNTALTWHLSLELAYRHGHRDYYALSMLQKAVSPTEGTAWLLDDPECALQVRSRLGGADAPAQTFMDWLQTRFDGHFRHLAGAVAGLLAGRGIELPAARALGRPWALLLPEGETPARGGRLPATPLSQLGARVVCLLEDPWFFALLSPDIRTGLRDFARPAPARDADAPLHRRYREGDLTPERLPPAQLDYYFLSGFFQNIVDFLRQDVSEIKDGTDPIYPPADQADGDSHFLVYATQSVIYEVVAASRSLEVGRGWIGTCPYLFLVHLMTLHNELLVRRYETMVRALIDRLEGDGLLDGEAAPGSGIYATSLAEDAFDAFRRFRIETFAGIAKHRYFNVLRYDTERAFYDSVEAVRGIAQREAYWAGVVGELERTIDDLRGNEAKKSERFVGRVLFYVAFLGLLQLVYQLVDAGVDGQWLKFKLDLFATAVFATLMLVLLHARGLLVWRRLGRRRVRRWGRKPDRAAVDRRPARPDRHENR